LRIPCDKSEFIGALPENSRSFQVLIQNTHPPKSGAPSLERSLGE
jgi:hypothetical protein